MTPHAVVPGDCRPSRRLARLAILALLLTGPIAVSAAEPERTRQETVQETKEGDVQRITDGLKQSASKLERGVYRVRGRTASDPAQPDTDGEWSLFSAFDQPAGRLRFDRQETILLFRDADDPTPGPDLGAPTPGGGKLVVTPDLQIRWHNDSNRLAEIRRPRDERDGVVRPIDVNALGLASLATLERGAKFEEARGFLLRPVNRVDRLDGRFFRVRLQTEGGGAPARSAARVEVTFDAGSGFRPKLYQMFLGSDAEGNFGAADETVRIQWTSRNGAWVPASASFERVGRKTTRRDELEFEWISVNEPVEEGRFGWQGMDLPGEVRIVDYRGVKPVNVRRDEVP